MAEPDNPVLTLLRELHRDMNDRFDKIDERFDGVDAKLAEHDGRFKSLSQALQGKSLLGRFATAEFDAIEKRPNAIESRS